MHSRTKREFFDVGGVDQRAPDRRQPGCGELIGVFPRDHAEVIGIVDVSFGGDADGEAALLNDIPVGIRRLAQGDGHAGGGLEQQIPPQAAVMTFGLPAASYVPTTRTGVGYTIVLAPNDFFMTSSRYLNISAKKTFMCSQERLSACSLYATPRDGSKPEAGLVKLCTAPP